MCSGEIDQLFGGRGYVAQLLFSEVCEMAQGTGLKAQGFEGSRVQKQGKQGKTRLLVFMEVI
jgi:hypothetical protein